MYIKPGSNYVGEFSTWVPATSSNIDADALPTATLSRNGVDDVTVGLTVTDKGVGRYSVTGVIPNTYAIGDRIAIWVFYRISNVQMGELIDQFTLDNTRDQLAALVNSTPANTVTYYGYSQYGDGSPISGRNITIKLVGGPQASGQAILETSYPVIETGQDGRWSAKLTRGKQWQIIIPEEDIDITVTASVDLNVTSVNINTLI